MRLFLMCFTSYDDPARNHASLPPAPRKKFAKAIDPTKVGWTVPAQGSSLRSEDSP